MPHETHALVPQELRASFAFTVEKLLSFLTCTMTCPFNGYLYYMSSTVPETRCFVLNVQDIACASITKTLCTALLCFSTNG